jgi:hypothetical protein
MEKLVDLVAAAPEWVFDWDSTTTLVAEDRTETIDLWDVPNEWVFVRTVDPGSDEAPSFGQGYLTVSNQSSGPASLDARAGRAVRSVTSIDAADQLAFEAKVSEIVMEEKSPSHIVEITASPVPLLWDREVVSYADSAIPGDIEAVTPMKMTVDSWSLPLDGSDATYTLSVVSTDILATPPPAVISGGTSSFDANGFHYEVFTADGTLLVASNGMAEVWVIGGGGGGGGAPGGGTTGQWGGGGGGGDLVHGSYLLDANIAVTIGAAGAGAGAFGVGGAGGDGGTTLFGGVASAIGGGGGGGYAMPENRNGRPGACGGGGGVFFEAVGVGGFGSVGYDGGDGAYIAVGGSGGGGGGGINGPGGSHRFTPTVPPDGGAGIGLAITSSLAEIFYCAGGGGASVNPTHAGDGGSDGAGGAGARQSLTSPPDPGSDAGHASTNGSGGGGGAGPTGAGGNGKAGLVVVRTAIA